MKVLICIDDTDNLESAGTGEMLQNICKLLTEEQLCTEGFVSRHQLLIHESIKYTSHNSSMCCELKNVRQEDMPRIIGIAADYLEHEAAPGSDPGLCLVQYEKIADTAPLVAYGQRAKTEVLSKQTAYDFAAGYPESIHLSEHGGTGEGVIGALAGCGLRLSGSDGKIKGKMEPRVPNEIISVREFCERFNVCGVYDTQWRRLSDEESFLFAEGTKAILHEGRTSVLVRACADAAAPYISLSKTELKELGVGW